MLGSMNTIRHTTQRLLLSLLLVTAITACNTTTTERGSYSARLIVKFIPEIKHPEESAYIEKLGRRVATRITYMRPLSGDAHLLRAEGLAGANEVTPLLEQLNQLPDTIYAEQDRRRTTQ